MIQQARVATPPRSGCPVYPLINQLSVFVINRIYNKIIDRDLFGARSRWFIITGIQFDTHVIRVAVTCAFMTSFALFPTVFKTYQKGYRRFPSKEILKF